MGSISIWHWLVVLLVVAMIFGTSKLKNIGKDLGAAVKGFREGTAEVQDAVEDKEQPKSASKKEAQ
jgi:sec-independent protein translocase protein TatA